jgi:hypothetical protein
MARPRRQSALLPGNDIEHLRRILIFARDSLSLSRSEIAKAADVSAFDLDNFTLSDPRSNSEPRKFKSLNPKLEFQRRALYFVLNNPKIARAASDPDSPIRKSMEVLNGYRSNVTEPKDEDTLYRHLVKIKAVSSIDECVKITDRLAGNYYVYRTLARTNKIVKAHMQISSFDVYNKVPRFVHRRRDDNDSSIIRSKGTILDMNGRYILHGLVFGSDDYESRSPLGVKLMIVNHGGMDQSFEGIFLSCNEVGRYEFGKVKILKTPDAYSADRIRNVERDEINFRFDELILTPVNWKETLPHLMHALVCRFAREDERAPNVTDVQTASLK